MSVFYIINSMFVYVFVIVFAAFVGE